MKNIKQRLRKWILGIDPSKFNDVPSTVRNSSDLSDNYLFDFLNWSSDNGNPMPIGIQSGVSGYSETKIKIKPIDVLNELETVPTPFTILGIDDKISILRDKEKIIRQDWAKREVQHLIERLENRKKYIGNKDFFDRFMNTTDEKIQVLLDKYQLVKRSADIFIPEFPDEAIFRMKEYSDKVMELFGKSPIYYVIATEDNFKKSYQKRDPILLVQSPFGFFWQILGAWDKEMLLLSEL